MIQTLKNNIALIVTGAILALSSMVAPLALASVSYAQAATGGGDIQNNLCGGAGDLKLNGNDTAKCSTVTQNSESGLNSLITNIVNVFSIIVGVIAVIMIIIGGFRYITSGGDSNNVGAAKNTILYAIVGLIIVALAQVIVKFVLSKSTGTV